MQDRLQAVPANQRKAAGGALTAKQAPHRPGTAPALGLRAGRAGVIPAQTTLAREIPMWFRSLFDGFLARSSRPAARQRGRAAKDHQRPRSLHPLLEILEDRTLLSTYLVNSLTDTGAGSGLAGDLRYCVTEAISGNDTIAFGVTGTIRLGSALPGLNTSVAIQGPGADLLTVERDPVSNTSFGIFGVGSAATVQISGLTLACG